MLKRKLMKQKNILLKEIQLKPLKLLKELLKKLILMLIMKLDLKKNNKLNYQNKILLLNL